MKLATGITASVTVALGIAAYVTPAVASHTTPAHLGRYVDPGDETCFRPMYDQIRNVCSTARRFQIPVHHYWNGMQNATINVTAANPMNPTYCELMTGRNGFLAGGNGGQWTSVYGTPQNLYSSANFASDAPGWVLCTVGAGGAINHVWFSGS
jgi:hypothetical protein